jgi:PAS domain S-box-containing protein
MKLSVRLFLLVVIAALPIFAMQVHGLLQDRAQRKVAIAEQAITLARLAAAQQDQFIEGARYLLAAAAQLPDVHNHDPAGCSARLGEILELFPMISGLGAADPAGNLFCSGRETDEPTNISDRGYFQRALERKGLAISGFIIGRSSGVPQLNFAFPALDDQGEVRAVVVLTYRLAALAASLPATPLPDGATISLVDGNGVLLARSPPAPDWIGQRAREAAFARTMLTRREGVEEGAGIDGVLRLHGFAPLLASADLFAVVGLPWQAAFREADRLFWQSAIVTALAFVAAALLALLGGHAWIRRPVAALQRVVGRMEHGDLAARARLERWSSPELHRLAASFNGMASALQARQAALQESEARLRAVVDTAADGIITINQRGLIEEVNPTAENLFGYRRDELIGANVSRLMPSPDRERHDGYLSRYLRTGEARIIGIGREVTGQRKDGTTLPLSLSIGEFTLDGGRFFTGILRDVTERKRAEQHQALLMAEIDHRAKNLLAAIQAMVMLTKPTGRSVGEYAETLVGRLHAMSRAHDLLARDKWAGARLHELIRNEFAAYVGADGHALRLQGEDVMLTPRAAQTLSLALHELTTNAAKYGALSVPHGRVEVDTSIESTPDGRDLRLCWSEAGGPAVTPPDQRGFGSVLIERGIAHDLDGSTSLAFDALGVRCEIRVPLD